jgi:hypothetical protein
MTKTFQISMWFGLAARGRDISRSGSATYVDYTETHTFRAKELPALLKRLEAEARRDHPRCGRQKLWDVRVEVL